MDNIDSIVNQLSNEVFHQDLTIKPSYYNDLNKIFSEQDLSKMLRHEIIKKNDQSIPLFLTVVKEYFNSLENKSVAILCSGSGLLFEEIYHNVSFYTRTIIFDLVSYGNAFNAFHVAQRNKFNIFVL
ncbi:MAG: hypothetical protein F6K40_34350 [Okeania sp. SIO3I5]|uniref:hypothetical protein n=1 Tax=Okeania sp. SIO3I5 TaxID=2607805 RepID=UPI0013B77C02|nr:hypothetical protein [Okeania sp. SIO3I5]NEQ41020.1 hypothetical protein [Okeania sp. SIO3I5]